MDKNAIKLGIFLMIVAGLTALALAGLNDLTKGIIAENQQKEMQKALQEVYPAANEFVDVEPGEGLQGISEIIHAEENGELKGVIYTLDSVGYDGPITMMVAYDLATGEITGMRILAQTETPGLGANAADQYFLDRFTGASADGELVVVKNPPEAKNEIEALTAATVTSKAVVRGINTAAEHFRSHYLKGGTPSES